MHHWTILIIIYWIPEIDYHYETELLFPSFEQCSVALEIHDALADVYRDTAVLCRPVGTSYTTKPKARPSKERTDG